MLGPLDHVAVPGMFCHNGSSGDTDTDPVSLDDRDDLNSDLCQSGVNQGLWMSTGDDVVRAVHNDMPRPQPLCTQTRECPLARST